MSEKALKRKNRWVEKKALKKKERAQDMPQHRKEFEKPHPGSHATEDLAKLTETEDESSSAFPRKKIALLMGYCGAEYQGMQMNEGVRTIEAEVERALFKAGCIGRQNYGNLQKIQWARAARTDKGVSALAQLISTKISIPGGEANTISLVNSHLPPDIKCFDMVKVTKSFDAKINCGKRRYHYLLPTYMLMDPDSLTKLLDEAHREAMENTSEPQNDTNLDSTSGGGGGGGGGDVNSDGESEEPELKGSDKPWLPKVDPSKSHRVELSKQALGYMTRLLEKFRVDKSTLSRLKEALAQFVGSHRFHNYTNHKKIGDPSALRYMHSFTVSEPFLVSGQTPLVDGMDRSFNLLDDLTPSGIPADGEGVSEWVQLEVVGQSFLLHQIRKMVATAVDFARKVPSANIDNAGIDTNTADDGAVVPEEHLSQEDVLKMVHTMDAVRVRTPMVPGLGLYLDRPFFCDYNLGIKTLPLPQANASKAEEVETRRPLDWEEGETAKLLTEFKATAIWPHIFKQSAEQGTFADWLNSLDCYPVDYSDEDAPRDATMVLNKPCVLETSSDQQSK